MIVATLAMWRPGTIPSGWSGFRLEVHLPGWTVLALAAAAVLACVAILSILIAPPRRKHPDDFELESPPPPRLSPLTSGGILFGGLAGIVAAVAAMRQIVLDRTTGGYEAGSMRVVVAPGSALVPHPAVQSAAFDVGQAHVQNLAATAVLSVIAGMALAVLAQFVSAELTGAVRPIAAATGCIVVVAALVLAMRREQAVSAANEPIDQEH